MKRTKSKGIACVECGATMRAAKGDFRFMLGPRWWVTVADSALHRCPKCGRREGTVRATAALERKVSSEVLRKAAPLAPEEVRFLVECFEWTKREVAARLGVTPETLSRYEQGTYRISPSADRLLRLMVAVQYLKDRDLALAVVSQAATKQAGEPLKLTLRWSLGDYDVVAGAESKAAA